MKYVFFDLDGTLTDPGLGITNSVRFALESYGIREENREKLYPFIGPPLVDSFMKYYGFSEEQAKEALLRYRVYFSETGLFENEVYRGIPELLSDLKSAGKTIVLATSKPEVYSRQILEHFDLDSYFDFVCGAAMDESKRSRKDEVLSYALEVSGADPSCSCMVGDRLFDMEAGKRFGLISVGVLYGYGSREELEEAGADVLCESVEKLREVLLA